jgi:hypothetical protein
MLTIFVQQLDVKCTELAVGKPVTMTVHPKDGKPFDIKLHHSFNESQIEWFKEGSALNASEYILMSNTIPLVRSNLFTVAKARKSKS